MSGAVARVGVGTRFRYDGETVEAVQMAATTAGNEVVLKDGQGRLLRVSLAELLFSDRAAVIPDGPGPSADDDVEIASVLLGQLGATERAELLERAEHVREVITGFRSGSSELARDGEPRQEYDPELSRETRYAAKAAELGVALRTVKQWVADFRSDGEVGLTPKKGLARRSQVKADERWVETALEVMVERVRAASTSRATAWASSVRSASTMRATPRMATPMPPMMTVTPGSARWPGAFGRGPRVKINRLTYRGVHRAADPFGRRTCQRQQSSYESTTRQGRIPL